jgi:hypothetical protein
VPISASTGLDPAGNTRSNGRGARGTGLEDADVVTARVPLEPTLACASKLGPRSTGSARHTAFARAEQPVRGTGTRTDGAVASTRKRSSDDA